MPQRIVTYCDRCQEITEPPVRFRLDTRWPKGTPVKFNKDDKMCAPVSEDVFLCPSCAGEVLCAVTSPYALEHGAALIQYIRQRDPKFSILELKHVIMNLSIREYYQNLPGDPFPEKESPTNQEMSG